MNLTDKKIKLLKSIPFLQSSYCWWRIRQFRKRQKSNFGNRHNQQSSGKSIWDNNIGHEVDFWETSLNEGGFQERLDPHYLNSPELGEVLQTFLSRNEIKALDVGCGPISTLGKKFKSLNIVRTLVDPLASSYYPMLSRMNVPESEWPMEAEGEKIGGYYSPESFDLVYMCNALDHCHDPFEVVIQLAKLVAPGGVLYLEHFENEAEKEDYFGLHQWNLYEEQGDLWMANRTVMQSMKKLLGDQFMVKARPIYRKGGFVIATALKNT